MSRELWSVERCPHKYEYGAHYIVDENERATGECPGLTRTKLDFDTIWERYDELTKWRPLTKDELRKVIGLEPEEDE